MNRLRRLPKRCRRIAAVAATLLVAASGAISAESLTVRAHDVQGEPGALVALTLSTYSPRSISQGQMCFTIGPAGRLGLGGPFASVEDVIVWSDLGDGSGTAELGTVDGQQVLMVDFESLSATINASDDGPFAAILLRLESFVAPGATWELPVDLGVSWILDPAGDPIPVEYRTGELAIRAPGSPFELEADGGEAAAGTAALVGIQSAEIFLLGSGTVELLYPSAIVDGPPVVSMDDRHGSGTFVASEPTSGSLLINFISPLGNLNEIPGDLFRIELPLSHAAPIGSVWPLTFGGKTQLRDPNGTVLPMSLENGDIEVTSPVLFADGFESGDLSAWSNG